MHLISINDFTNKQIVKVLDLAEEIREHPEDFQKLLDGKILANVFFQPSTRTRISFESAMLRLGGKVINIGDMAMTSTSKGESFEDTVRMLDDYADIMVIRHFEEDAVKDVKSISQVSLINAGNGMDEHPTQALVDFYTIRREFKRLNSLNVVICGDLLYGRTVHSLIHVLIRFNNRIYLVPGGRRGLNKDFRDNLEYLYPDMTRLMLFPETTLFSRLYALYPEKGLKMFSSEYLRSIANIQIIRSSDSGGDIKPSVLYMTRNQQGTVPINEDAQEYDPYPVITPILLESKFFNEPIIMHPLPRGPELPVSLDNHPRSRYFEQAQNGLYVREALLLLMLNVVKW
mgnify:FL=1